MPEYLAPGVYVEEIEIGAKPIEGVSTTTTGFIGMAERGPLNKPTLVTSFAEYQRIFGGYLAEKDHNSKKGYGKKRWLPYAVEGFFVNGGQRLYVSRVAVEDAAKPSVGYLPDITKNDSSGKDVGAGGVTPKSPKALILDGPLNKRHAASTTITKMEKDDATSYKIDGAVKAKDTEITFDGATDLTGKPVLIINDGTNTEVCVVESVADDEKTITVKAPLRWGHSKGVELNKLTSSNTTARPISAVEKGKTTIPIDVAETDFNQDDVVKIGDEYFTIKETDVAEAPGPATEVEQFTPAIKVEAANAGTWGNRIKITVTRSPPTVAKLTETAQGQDYLDLDTVTGMEKGTLLELNTKPPSYGTITKVIKTEDVTRVKLQNAVTGSPDGDPKVSIVEFDLMVNLDDTGEVFKNLSMNKEHSRYIEEIITEETSRLIRVADVSDESLPKKPVPTNDGGKDIVWRLDGGDDGISEDDDGAINTTYEGSDNTEPSKRKGLYTLKNVDGISIVAIPGITTQHLQNKLIIHCETMKDRFAVMDSIEMADLDDIQEQSNFYDSKYAALYYPWIRVFDPLSKKRTNVPPSGYMCGIYARSDTERGVHKAPANEIVRGALSLEEEPDGVKRVITKGQQDILNPMGVNCIRTFRGRGIRVWGARTTTSDSLWKYINVRRLFIFLEESIEDGTQWAVFEPNDEKLWARVRQTITQFLTSVWKDGALMGSTPGEAFFVKCDRTTMTQDDIDNGRLIVQIGVAPVKPAEFVIFRIAQWQGGSAATE